MKSKTPTYTQFSFLLNIHLAKKMCQLTGLWLGIKRSENWGLKRSQSRHHGHVPYEKEGASLSDESGSLWMAQWG